MKKALVLFGALLFFCSVSWGNDCKSSQKMHTADNCGCAVQCEKKNKKACEQEIDDDEYCTYNQCYFDRQFRKMKRALCLTRSQENFIYGL